ncbi:MAG: NAD(P)/FAD-dependent oxidoreductase [Planctomycetota bacterium]|jgi:predicted NAD/FAD-dependent oxidoreductase
MTSKRIAVVGAGIAGLNCLRRLQAAGLDVSLFDKARGSGGRSSTRRGEDSAFDHGAQYFTLERAAFAEEVELWHRAGVAREWLGKMVNLQSGKITAAEEKRRFVGVPGMSSICRHLTTDCATQYSFRVEKIQRRDGGLRLHGEKGLEAGEFAAVVLAMPSPQAAVLAADLAPDLAKRAGRIEFSPCWSVMLESETRLPIEFDAAFVHASELSWVARNSSKPERPERECWVLQAAPIWSELHLDSNPSEVCLALQRSFETATAIKLPKGFRSKAHRWAYAQPKYPLNSSCLFDADSGIGACGDWCSGPRIEGAFLSGLAMAEQLLEHFSCGN